MSNKNYKALADAIELGTIYGPQSRFAYIIYDDNGNIKKCCALGGAAAYFDPSLREKRPYKALVLAGDFRKTILDKTGVDIITDRVKEKPTRSKEESLLTIISRMNFSQSREEIAKWLRKVR
jgi:hypothetical protein